MRPIPKLTALCLSGLLPLTAAAFDMHFLDQAPMRYFTKQDMDQFQATVDLALDETASGDSRQWTNDASGSSGTVKVANEFTEDGLSCRRLAITNRTKQAEARSVVDMCIVDGVWKVLRMP